MEKKTFQQLKAEAESLQKKLDAEIKKYVYPVRIVKMPYPKVVKS